MKILWITNILMNKMSLEINKKESPSFWMDVLIRYFEQDEANVLNVASPYKVSSIVERKIDNVYYYALPNALPGYLKDTKKIRLLYKEFLKRINPDIINIWGTEYLHCHIFYELSIELDIPCVFFVQGILDEIAKYSFADLPQSIRKKYITLRDIYRKELLFNESSRFYKIAKYEKTIFENKINYIYENDWCKSRLYFFNKNSKGYSINLPISNCFFTKEKKYKTQIKDNPVIICNASGYPLKGLHIVLQSIYLLKEYYPKIKLIVPGNSILCPTSFIKRQKYPGYYVYISKLIKRLNITENVEFTGFISPEELANKTVCSDIFVLSSSIENHSGSLKEAMALGMPCIASAVGGIDAYVKDKQNALLYRFGDYKMLAYRIKQLIDDDRFRVELGTNAKASMINNKNQLSYIYEQFVKCYEDIVNKRGKQSE